MLEQALELVLLFASCELPLPDELVRGSSTVCGLGLGAGELTPRTASEYAAGILLSSLGPGNSSPFALEDGVIDSAESGKEANCAGDFGKAECSGVVRVRVKGSSSPSSVTSTARLGSGKGAKRILGVRDEGCGRGGCNGLRGLLLCDGVGVGGSVRRDMALGARKVS